MFNETAECAGEMMKAQNWPTLAEKLSAKSLALQEQLSDIKRLEELLQKNPDIQEILTRLGRSARNLL